jgi:hypothetical protein
VESDLLWDLVRGLEIVLVKTFCRPKVSKVLERTGKSQPHGQQRYDDTSSIFLAMMNYGLGSDKGGAALAKMNGIHSKFTIGNKDFLYVLAGASFAPVEWVDRYAYGPLSGGERAAYFNFRIHVGQRMGLRDVPQTVPELQRFRQTYESENFGFAHSNRVMYESVVDVVKSWFPPPLRVLPADALVASFVGEPASSALGLKRPLPAPARVALRSALHARSQSGRARFAVRSKVHPLGRATSPEAGTGVERRGGCPFGFHRSTR